MKNKKNLIIVSMMVIVAVMAIGYSFFATRLNINSLGNITSEWNIYFSNVALGTVTGSASNASTPSVTGTTANMEANLALPGDSITYELTLTNGGTIGAIIEDIEAKAEGSSAIIYSISGIKIGDKLAGGESIVIIINIEYDPNFTSQPSETSKTLTVSIDAVQDIGQSITPSDPTIEGEKNTLASAILKDNTAYADNVASEYVTSSTGIDFSAISSDTNGKGLYYTSTNTEDDKTTYYFRGDVENNYVSFAGQTWKIVRINEDGSIRLIKQSEIGMSVFNNSNDDVKYSGYMYGDSAADNTNKNSSVIKEYLDTWYENNLKDSYSSYLADAGFCNDRTLGIWTRINDTGVTFACSQESDLFTTSSSDKGNQSLTYPIGLLTADEVIYAGSGYDVSHNYLSSIESSDWWTMTPCDDMYGEGKYMNNKVYGGGINVIYYLYSNETASVIPVINLKADVEIVSGNGTVDAPYVIKTSE